MHTVSRRARRGRRSPVRPIPPVLDPTQASDEATNSVSREVTPVAVEPPSPRARPLERDAEGREIDWGRNSTLKTGNANLVMLWFLVPLVLLILWQLFFDGGPQR